MRVYGVNDFVVDHPSELGKLIEIAGPGHIIQVRLRTPGVLRPSICPPNSARMKIWAWNCCARLWRKNPGLRCRFMSAANAANASAYAKAFEIVARVLSRAGVAPEYINVGGGFPVSDAETEGAAIGRIFCPDP